MSKNFSQLVYSFCSFETSLGPQASQGRKTLWEADFVVFTIWPERIIEISQKCLQSRGLQSKSAYEFFHWNSSFANLFKFHPQQNWNYLNSKQKTAVQK